MPWDKRAPAGDNWTFADYAPATRLAILRAQMVAQRLATCTVCGKRPIRRRGVLLPQALRRLVVPAGMRPSPYAVCARHNKVSDEELGDTLLPGWREHQGP